MPLAVVFSPRARADLEEIRQYIGKHNSERADSFVEELYAKALTLSENGSRFAVVPRYRLLAIRSVSHRRYLILYQIAGDTVGVLRIVHAARDLTQLLG